MVFGGGTGIAAVGPKIFIWPLVCCFLAAAYVWFYCPETTGRTLEEIDVLFAKSGAHHDALEQAVVESRGRRKSAHSADQIFTEKSDAEHIEGKVDSRSS